MPAIEQVGNSEFEGVGFTAVEKSWYDRIVALHDGHFVCSKRCQRMHFWWGVPTAFLTAVSGSAVLATWESSSMAILRLVAGGATVLTAGISAALTFLGYKERSESHRNAGVQYGRLRCDIEKARRFGTSAGREEFWSALLEQLKRLDAETPTVPEKILRRARDRKDRVQEIIQS